MISKQQQKYPFVDLTNDRVFKHYFSRDSEVLLSLLKAFLPLPDKKSIQGVEIISDKKAKAEIKKAVTKNQHKIEIKSHEHQSLTLKDPALYPPSIGGKHSILDLNIQLNTGERVDVEMQAVNQDAFSKRVVFYWAKLHSMGLNMSEGYSLLYPTYSLVFTTFPLLGKEEGLGCINSFSIRLDKPPHIQLNDQLQMVFVDLSRFEKKNIEELVDEQEQWCYLLKESGRLSREQAGQLARKGEDMAKAVGLFDNVSARDLEFLKRRTQEREHWDRLSMKAEAFRKGKAEGMQAVALNMLNSGFDTPVISKATGLSVEEIKSLKNGS